VENLGSQMENIARNPSDTSYSSSSRAQEQQWGAGISPDAIKTKLGLALQENRSEELELALKALYELNNWDFDYVETANRHPGYAWKGPEGIVTEYLTKILQNLLIEIKNFSPELRASIPVDIVVIVPMV